MHALVMVINGKKCTSELMKRISGWLSLIGYVFIAGVAIISALQVTNNVLKCLLILSAMVSLVLGLRDMYSTQYIKDAGKREIVETVSQQHIESVREALVEIEGGAYVDFHFAIMEVEAWFLGMSGFAEKLTEFRPT